MNITNTRELIENWPGLESDVRADLLLAVATRGKNKGYLLANAPSQYAHPRKWAAWTAFVGNLAPARLSIWGVLFGPRDLYDRLDTAVLNSGLAAGLNAVEPAFRWNLWCHRHDGARALKAINEYCSKGEK